LETAFDPIVATDRNTSYPHYRGGAKRLGSLVLVDYGVKSGHYCSDVTRCFILDGDGKKKAQYERLQDICWFIADSLPNLNKGKEVAELANDLMAKGGFPKLIHSIGHGVGLEIHESPSLGQKSDDALAGATMAIEPAFYLSGYGMRYEETVYNAGKKAKIL
jgi:Xaa-Pro aminopeptidase